MNVELAAFTIAPALAIGSFLNVIAARVPLRRSIVSPGPHAWSAGKSSPGTTTCRSFSYVVLRGRCRNCQASISWRYPAVEAVTAALIALCALKFGLTWDFAIAALFCAALVTVSATDLELRVIPNRIVVPSAIAVLAANTLLHPSVEWVAAGLGAALFFLLAALAYPGGMGMGDVKLAFLLGVGLGRTVPVAMMIGMISALVPSVVCSRATAARRGRWRSRSARSWRSEV